MRDEMEFDMLLSSVLHEVSNPEPMEGVEQRVMGGFSMMARPEARNCTIPWWDQRGGSLHIALAWGARAGFSEQAAAAGSGVATDCSGRPDGC